MKKEALATALGIALLPPLWAVLSGHVGVSCGGAALVCAGVYAANGNKAQDGLRISLGFLLSDLMAVAAIWCMENLPFAPDTNTFVTLAVIGFAAVLVALSLERWVFLPAVLCGWAVGLTVMAPLGFSGLGSMPVQLAVSMLVGVWYVGWGVDRFVSLACGVAPKE